MLFRSKNTLTSKQVNDELSITRDEVKFKLARLSDITKCAETSLKQASDATKEVIKMLDRRKIDAS